MFKNLLQLYSMVICLFATLILMFTLVQVMQNTITLVLPEYKYNYDTAKFNSVEDFINSKNPQEAEKIRLLSEAEIDKKMNLEKTNYIQKVEKEAVSSLINNASWIITSLIFFIIHWLLYQKSSKTL
ncbi:hypothetical protein [Candidatus Tisiphia endosymbiont of Oplodontha viridula]|uniref:hypothetical protein n=1 Tax=Candidatus Tisiphia endosymbiont of Oplodontha viridula TaxID=3077925 RepID=UPI0035C8B290